MPFLKNIFVCVCICVCVSVCHMGVCPHRTKEGTTSLGAGVASGFESPDVGAGTQTQIQQSLQP